MRWLLLIVALLGLAFPPLAIVVIGAMVMMIFAKGMGFFADPDAESDGLESAPGRRRRSYPKVRLYEADSPREQIIDVPFYPVRSPDQLPKPETEQQHRSVNE